MVKLKKREENKVVQRFLARVRWVPTLLLNGEIKEKGTKLEVLKEDFNILRSETFFLFSSQDEVKKFLKYINSRHRNVKFSYVLEQLFRFLGCVSHMGKHLLHVIIQETHGRFYSDFTSFMPESYNKGLMYTLLHRAFTLCCGWTRLHSEVTFLK